MCLFWFQCLVYQCSRDRLIIAVLYSTGGLGERSRYSDSLRGGLFWDRILVGSRFSAPVQTGRGAHVSSCTMGTGSFAGLKKPRRGVDHPLPCSAEVKEITQLWLFPPTLSGPSWPLIGWSLFTVNFIWCVSCTAVVLTCFVICECVCVWVL